MWDDKRKPGGGHTSGFSVPFGMNLSLDKISKTIYGKHIS